MEIVEEETDDFMVSGEGKKRSFVDERDSTTSGVKKLKTSGVLDVPLLHQLNSWAIKNHKNDLKNQAKTYILSGEDNTSKSLSSSHELQQKERELAREVHTLLSPSPKPLQPIEPCFSLFQNLFPDLQRHILSFLPLSTFTALSSCSHSIHSLSTSPLFRCHHRTASLKRLSHTCHKVVKIASLLRRSIQLGIGRLELAHKSGLISPADFVHEKQAGANNAMRISYLKTTIADLIDLLDSTPIHFLSDQESPSISCFYNVIQVMEGEVKGTWEALVNILSGKMEMTVNFDIFELALRRYYHQLKVMFIDASETVRSTPALLIKDNGARNLWIDLFGSETYFVPFDRFMNDVVTGVLGVPPSGDVCRTIKFFLNFPVDNMVTTYKFHLLMCHWGPLSSLIQNLNKFALRHGFLGLINAIQASEILKTYSSPRILMRFSRLEPEKLTISFSDSYGKVHHSRKPVDIQIDTYLSRNMRINRPHFVPKHLDWLELESKKTALDYAQVSSGYY